MSAEDVKKELARVASPEKAAYLPRFFKALPGGYAEGDVFLGVTVPEQRRVARRHRDLPLSEVAELVRSPVHEHRFTGLLVLVARFESGESSTRERLFAFCREHLARVNHWDLVDLVAPRLIGPHLVEHPETRPLLDTWVRSASVWERRIAIMSTWAFIRRGEVEETLRLAGLLVEDRHEMVHKAVGWMLREVGKKDRAREEAFLERHAARMPRTMLRYALEHFSPERRVYYMRLQR